MIAVNIAQDGITVDGHAGYAETGKDIVCAAVSALTQNLINSIEALTDDLVRYTEKNGHMEIKWENLSEQGKLLVDSFFIGICAIVNTYGEKYMQISMDAGQA